jgi:hypothetical protein
MRRLALTLATAVLASGCIIGDDDDDDFVGVGSAIVYWDFLRNAPAQPGGAVLYDDATLVQTGTGACTQSAVDVVTIDTAGLQPFEVPCVYQGVQGATLDGLPTGSLSARIRGWRGNSVVYDRTVAFEVFDGQVTDQGIIDVDPVQAPIDIVAYFSNAPDQFFMTCNAAGNPEVDYELWDSFPTLVATGTVPCGVGGSAFPLDLLISYPLDLDNYSIRMKGFIGATRQYDSCTSESAKFMAFDHFAAQTGEQGIPITLFEPPACTEL